MIASRSVPAPVQAEYTAISRKGQDAPNMALSAHHAYSLLTHAFFAKKSGQFLDKSGKRAYNDRISQYFGNIQENKFQRWTNREPGANPGRSRHCVGEQAAYVTEA